MTGSGRENGIGAAIARNLARNGANVAIHYVSESSKPRAQGVAEAITKEFGTKTTVVQGAIEKLENADKLVDETLKGLATDHIDILGTLNDFHFPHGSMVQSLIHYKSTMPVLVIYSLC